MADLLPCPFCGGPASVDDIHFGVIGCSACDVWQTGASLHTWNRRTEPRHDECCFGCGTRIKQEDGTWQHNSDWCVVEFDELLAPYNSLLAAAREWLHHTEQCDNDDCRCPRCLTRVAVAACEDNYA